MIVAWDAPSIPALATAIAAGAGATTLVAGPPLPVELRVQNPPVSAEQRAAIGRGYTTGMVADISLGQSGEIRDLMRSIAVGPHGPFAKLGCAAALLGGFACQKATAASQNAALQAGGDAVYATSKLVTGLVTHDFRVVDAALAYGTVAAHALEIARPGFTTAIEAATAGADLAVGHPDAIAALTDIAALQLVPNDSNSENS